MHSNFGGLRLLLFLSVVVCRLGVQWSLGRRLTLEEADKFLEVVATGDLFFDTCCTLADVRSSFIEDFSGVLHKLSVSSRL